ncbi:protein serine/threonine phosphatase 2C [Chloropicon primus]|uniref:Protein serine/threonine phosphatase 2C n=1 Tax=Chloropicon primus TaxID=1764295 RepID=A0A5B8MDK7_9CHLO|nr:protein serine/threonine phosphatase 2C [Chloropicon primus]|eukprot:QDZ18678.1 protein serine/threonine phosphatase 2C [Chloropicon primus]
MAEETTRCFRGCCASRSVRLDVGMAEITGCSEVIAKGAASKVKRGLYRDVEVAVKFPSLPTTDDLNRFHKELGIHLEFTGRGRGCRHIVPLVGARAHPPHYVTLTPLARCNLAQLVHEAPGGGREGAGALGLLGLGLQIARGVESLHGRGYVHRDLKPANVLITADGEAQLTDFQLTEKESELVDLFSSSEARLSNSGKKPSGGFHKKLLVGTLEYMAPEILTKTSHTRESDVYSLGILLNELFTGVFPFSDCSKERPGCHTVLELGYGHQELKAAVVSEGLRPTMLEAKKGSEEGDEEEAQLVSRLNGLLAACWSLNAQERPAIGEVCATLESILFDYSGTASGAGSVEGSGSEATAVLMDLDVEQEGVVDGRPLGGTAIDEDLVLGSRGEEDSRIAESLCFSGGALKLNAGSFQTIGGRDSQEDRIVQSSPSPYFEGLGVHLLAVFDGHRGSEASEYCARHVEKVLTRCLREAALGKSGDSLDSKKGLPRQALERAFQVLDESFFEAHEGCNAGATSLVCLVCESKVFVANCGDCRCIVGGPAGVRELSRDHTTASEGERERVMASKGGALRFQVDAWRIGSCGLQVTRSIGDADVKPLGVISVPEVVEHDLREGDDFICLASDGLWDVVSSEEVAGMVRDTVKNPSMVAQRLGLEACSRGSRDNISVLVAFTKQGLGSHEKIFEGGREKHGFTQTFYGSR